MIGRGGVLDRRGTKEIVTVFPENSIKGTSLVGWGCPGLPTLKGHYFSGKCEPVTLYIILSRV